MQLTVVSVNDDKVVQLDVEASETLDNVRAIVEVETGIPSAEQLLVCNNNELTGDTLTACSVADGDLIMLSRRPAAEQRAAAAGSAAASAEAAARQALAINPQDGSAVHPQALIDFLSADPYQLSTLEARNPTLGDIIRAKNVERLQQYLKQEHAAKLAAEQAARELLAGDPLDPAVQARIAEAINRKNIDENLEAAMEHTPEAFAQVYMLYVDAEVNSHHMKTFVDSGAQMSIMTVSCAEKCNLMRLVDQRYQGIARGVGQTKIIGRIHQVPLKVQGQFLTLSVSVLDQKGGPQFILGLDMLKRYQCCIDLEKNELRFSNVGVKLPFLAEHELPKEDSKEAAGAENMEEDGELQKALEQSLAKGDAVAATGAGASPAGGSGKHPPDATPAAAAAAAAAQRAAAAATAPAPAAGAAAAVAAASPGEDKIQRLMALGFPRQQAVAALEMCNGNEELAASMLFGGL